MRSSQIALVLLVIALTATDGWSQVKHSKRSSSFSVPRVGGNKARIICPIFVESRYPYQGIGIKFGDPFAIAYKFYANKNFSFAVDAGKAATGLYNKYYRGVFPSDLPDTLSKDQSITYLAHTALVDWFVETKFLYQWDADKISKGLQLYAGIGWQWRNTELQYDYNFNDRSNNQDDGKFGKLTETRFTYGPVVLVGFEYSYFSLPISAFIEVEIFTDTLIDPGYQRFQGGVGLRYVF